MSVKEAASSYPRLPEDLQAEIPARQKDEFMYFPKLPPELWIRIFRFAGRNPALFAVSKRCHALAKEAFLKPEWEKLKKQFTPDTPIGAFLSGFSSDYIPSFADFRRVSALITTHLMEPLHIVPALPLKRPSTEREEINLLRLYKVPYEKAKCYLKNRDYQKCWCAIREEIVRRQPNVEWGRFPLMDEAPSVSGAFSLQEELSRWLTNPNQADLLECVEVLDLRGKGIRTVPPELEVFPRLRSLRLEGNLYRKLPRALCPMANKEGIPALNEVEGKLELVRNQIDEALVFFMEDCVASLLSRIFHIQNTEEEFPGEIRQLGQLFMELSGRREDLEQPKAVDQLRAWMNSSEGREIFQQLRRLKIAFRCDQTILPKEMELLTHLLELELPASLRDQIPESIKNIQGLRLQLMSR